LRSGARRHLMIRAGPPAYDRPYRVGDSNITKTCSTDAFAAKTRVMHRFEIFSFICVVNVRLFF
jgi:hypothetical protein